MSTYKKGITNLPMHWGKAPRWLFSRMAKLAREITTAIISEYGSFEMLNRISDPYWFQAFGCVLGFDWHSSGVTTTVCGALKQGLKGLEKDLNFYIAGGKGGTSRKTPSEIQQWGEKVNIKNDPEELIYASRMTAKVDSSAIQDGYQLYHHNFFFTKEGNWAVVQQGMNKSTRYARRYHWLSTMDLKFTEEPNNKICDNKKYSKVLNLTSQTSSDARTIISDISKENPFKISKEYKNIITLTMPRREWIVTNDIKPENLQKILLKTYERQPRNFEELLSMKGIGPKSIRALALISELTYGTKADWEDPVKYSFAHGGKDGYPYPVDRENYDKSIEILRKAISRSRIFRKEKDNMMRKLIKFQI